MARYKQESIERVRESVDMLGLVGRKTDLRRVGSRWVGLCPFHEERTPSFSVNGEDKLYHCFGCGVGGDAIGFVMETEGLGFPEAVEQLAAEANVELERDNEDPAEEQRRKRRERLLGLTERTAGFYASYLWRSSEAGRARDYLDARGLSRETLEAFRVGYAPSAWDRLLLSARRDGYAEEELLATGLAQRSRSGRVFDRFRERIMFPLADARGRTLGFGARAMRDEQGAKYLNSAEGELYHKGRQLFGIDRARAAIARTGRVVVVEGYTDVLALHQAGVEETVAIMGTALTGEQLAELHRAVGEGTIHLALDADRAGREAMLRAARMADERGVSLLVAEMPEGTDPAELVGRGGAEAIAAHLRRSVSVVEFEVERVLAEADLDSNRGRDRALDAARALVVRLPPRSIVRDDLVRRVADRLDIPADYVSAAASAGAAPRPAPVHAGGDPGPERGSRPEPGGLGGVTLEAERRFLAQCLGAGPRGREQLERLAPGHFSSELTGRARDHLLEHFDDPLEGLASEAPDLQALVAGVAIRADEEARPSESSLRMSFLALEGRRIEREVRRAVREGDFALQGRLASERQRVRREMDTAMGEVS